jgi:asparagine synthase (glutamine-hydrolysing)
VDRDALAAFLYASFVPAPASIWQSTHKLPPGHMLTISATDIANGTLPAAVAYWALHEHAHRRAADGSLTDAEVVDQLDALLRDSVARQMVADVPLGAFLSGGIDSSTVVGLMQAQSSRPVKTFTVGIPDVVGLDESAFAAKVASHLGTEHHTLQVSAADARAVIPTLGTMYDEPFADASQIPTHLVAALAREHVTVSLSGDGGDELFGGYRRYQLAPSVARRTRFVPRPAARLGRASMIGVPVRMWDGIRPGLGARAHRVADLATNRGVDDVYRRVFGASAGAGLAIDHPFHPSTVFGAAGAPADPVDRMMYLDALTYLPDDICAKVDRAAMAVSLETRMPYLDHRVVEFSWSLPQRMLIRDGVSKWAVRQVLARYVPPALTERPKAGFGIPLADWLRGPLRDWGDDLLSPTTLRAQGYLDVDAVTKLWTAHWSRQRDHTNVLWNVLMFQTWLAVQH